MNFEINEENIQILWKMYEEYKKEFKERYYSDVKPMPFEYMVENHIYYCENTMEYKWEEEKEYCEKELEK